MNEAETTQRLLTEIRDNQRRMLENQERQIGIANEQLERARRQVEESIALQREAIARARGVTRVAVPGIVLCIAAIAWLVLRYF